MCMCLPTERVYLQSDLPVIIKNHWNSWFSSLFIVCIHYRPTWLSYRNSFKKNNCILLSNNLLLTLQLDNRVITDRYKVGKCRDVKSKLVVSLFTCLSLSFPGPFVYHLRTLKWLLWYMIIHNSRVWRRFPFCRLAPVVPCTKFI